MIQAFTPIPAPTPPASKRSVAVLVVILVGQFMAVLDASIVNVAIPALRTDLGAGGAGLQLIVTGYVIAYAVLLMTGARLGERYTPRRVFLAGLAGFTIASLACGLAWDELSLIVFRCAQGAAAAAMVPQVMTMIQRTFTGAARARALGGYAAIVSGGLLAGQLLGGLIVDTDLAGSSWRGVFLVNVPLGLVLLAAAAAVLPDTVARTDRRLDGAGLSTLAIAVLLLVVPLMVGHELGYPLWSWVCLGAGVAGFAVFAAVQRRMAACGREPLFAPQVVGAAGLLPAAGTLLVIMAVFGGWLFVISLHLQDALGYSALRAGVQFLPIGVTFAVAGLCWQRLPKRWHAGIVPVGMVLGAGALGWLAWLLADGAALGFAGSVAFGLLGVGNGLAFAPLMARALAAMPVTAAADAGGILITCVQLGMVLGVATFGSLFFALGATGVTDAVVTVQLAGGGGCLVAAALALVAVRHTRR
ncbi:MFS transporter [Nocardia halotolerans]|uniref:MFS transporter n=1 Tax=Nocardia halotolerans TaxID=1755878 RepID=A0ABV8VC49_9NOCA